MSTNGRPTGAPRARELPTVLREALARGPGLQLLVGTAVAAVGTGRMTVEIEGVEVEVPRLASATVTAGAPVYLLVSRDFMLALGSVVI